MFPTAVAIFKNMKIRYMSPTVPVLIVMTLSCIMWRSGSFTKVRWPLSGTHAGFKGLCNISSFTRFSVAPPLLYLSACNRRNVLSLYVLNPRASRGRHILVWVTCWIVPLNASDFSELPKQMTQRVAERIINKREVSSLFKTCDIFNG